MRRALGFVAVLAALSAAIVIGLVGGRIAPRPERITVSGDSYALTSAPTQSRGGEDHLIAGGVNGGAAISYLKFKVDLPAGEQPQRAWLWLGTDGGDLPGLIELSAVPDAGFDEKELTADNAPRLGRVISSVEPEPSAPAIAFDITDALPASGIYGFAVTAASGTESARFVAKESGQNVSAATITLEWAGTTPGAATIRPPGFTPTPRRTPGFSPMPTLSPWPSASPSIPASASLGAPSPSGSPAPTDCVTGPKLVPTCGTLWGVAPGAHSSTDRIEALAEFERLVRKPQLIYHAYHRGYSDLFPTERQIAVARDPRNPRILFLNWKPSARWGDIADGDRATDEYLDRLSAYLKTEFPEQFFFSFHHEPENDVVDEPGSGMTAKDYAAAYRYVTERLRRNGVDNAISTMSYMAYIPWNTKRWFPDLYPGDDVVDWVAWDEYAYSDPGYGHGDFAEFMNRRSGKGDGWPGFYNWAARTFPSKPLMLGEWGLWFSWENPSHQARFFESARLQLELFPRVKAYVYFESPDAGDGRDSRVDHTRAGLAEFQKLGRHPAFDVKLNSSG